MKRVITVHIAGQRYLVRSDADESYVQTLASTVDARVALLKGNRLVATQADFALAALQLADELHHERQSQKELKRQVGERARRVLDSLNRLSARPAEGS
ncbi:MAG: cell division protein ZapA [Myxococcales bacterium]|nr:cell division protein ZapA [Myxococcota bacterium]MDW8284255.1 cell division protein ZapA [Myxococcales bacterium]